MFHFIKSKLQLASCLALLFIPISGTQLLAGDCLNGVWPLVYDSEDPVQSLYNWGQFRGECEYGVDFGPPTTAYMQMPIGHMINEVVLEDEPFIFQMYVRPHQIYAAQQGLLRIMELSHMGFTGTSSADPLVTPVIGVQFGWSRPNRTNITNFFIRGSYSRPHTVFENVYEQEFMDPNIAQIPNDPDNNNVFHIVLIWKPATQRSAGDGYVEIYVNDHLLVQETGMRLSKTGPLVPTVVRYGGLNSSDRIGTGTLRFAPINPTPFRPYITQ